LSLLIVFIDPVDLRAVRRVLCSLGALPQVNADLFVPARSGRLVLIGDQHAAEEAGVAVLSWPRADYLTATSSSPEMKVNFAPIVYAAPIQMLAYHIAVIMGKDADQPRNLAKSVTVE
jgi:glucosamine--fructose-6-phosphate aminotransferase (isomerizing)